METAPATIPAVDVEPVAAAREIAATMRAIPRDEAAALMRTIVRMATQGGTDKSLTQAERQAQVDAIFDEELAAVRAGR